MTLATWGLSIRECTTINLEQLLPTRRLQAQARPLIHMICELKCLGSRTSIYRIIYLMSQKLAILGAFRIKLCCYMHQIFHVVTHRLYISNTYIWSWCYIIHVFVSIYVYVTRFSVVLVQSRVRGLMQCTCQGLCVHVHHCQLAVLMHVYIYRNAYDMISRLKPNNELYWASLHHPQ